MKHLTILITLLAMAPFAAMAQFAGGSGTSEDPWQVETLEHLQAINDHLDAHFIQIADIDASETAEMDGGAGWMPIETFTGTYNGAGHTIDSLTINRPGVTRAALFARVNEGGVIENLTITNASVSGNSMVAIAVGQLFGGNISNIHTSGAVSGTQMSGGVVGYLRGGGEIFRSSSSATVYAGDRRGGGLVGFVEENSVVRESFATGDVTGGNELVGGLAGLIRHGGSVYDSYATGNVSGAGDRIGGFVGRKQETASVIERSYATGTVEAGGSHAGGFAGQSEGPIVDSYWDMESSGMDSPGSDIGTGVTGFTTAEMTGIMAFGNMTGFDFQNIWKANPGYPALAWEDVEGFELNFAGGAGTQENPFQIAFLDQLMAVENFLDMHYIQIADIDASETADMDGGAGWTPLGTFTGTYNGDGYVIDNLTINRPGLKRSALFGRVNEGGRIENLSITNATVSGNSMVAIAVGQLFGGIISNIHTSGSVTGTQMAGGAVGYLRGEGEIFRSSSSATVHAGDRRGGGLVGFVEENSVVRESFATGDVTGGNELVGGFAGLLRHGGSVYDSYSTGSVNGAGDRVGGFVGRKQETASVIERSYATGTVEAGGSNVGGFAGQSEGPIVDSYWDVESSGMESPGSGVPPTGVMGLTTAQMTGVAPFNTMPGLDFATVWSLVEGYPALAWQDVEVLPFPALAQIIHNAADPDAEVVDVYVNGEIFADSLAFRSATPYVVVPAGEPLTIEIYPYAADASSTDPVYSISDVVFSDGEIYSIIADGLIGDGFADNPDGVNTDFALYVLPARFAHDRSDEVSFFIWHGATDAPAVDVTARDVAVLAEGLAYSDASDYISVSNLEYTLDLSLAGELPVIGSYFASFLQFGGETITILASGFMDPEENNDGPAFGLLAVRNDGSTFELESVAQPPPKFEVTFYVDMQFASQFDPEVGGVYISGSMIGWPLPGSNADYQLEPIEENSTIYSIDLIVEEGSYTYNYFYVPAQPSWNTAEWSGPPERVLNVTGTGMVHDFFGIKPGDGPFARVQIIHNAADPELQVVDVYVDGEIFLDSLAFRNATPFVNLPAARGFDLQIYTHGANPNETDAVFEVEDIELERNETYVVIANGIMGEGFAANPGGADIEFDLYLLDDEMKESHDDASEVSFYIWHGSTDAPVIDIYARDMGLLIDDFGYGEYTDYFDVPAGDYIVDITLTGSQEVIASYIASLTDYGGKVIGILASGFIDPEENYNGAAIELLAVLSDGTTFLLDAEPTSSEQIADLPLEFLLGQNYPNPFNPTTTIEFALPQTSDVVLEVFNIQGRKVATLVNETREAGVYSVSFDATSLASGVYLYRIKAGSFVKVQKMMLIK